MGTQDERGETMAKARIAYVDDDMELTTVVASVLEDAGYEVVVAHDGEAGLEMILTEQPDLIILDVMMPKLNGWELARYLRSKPDWNDTPILMLTGIGPTINDLTAPLYGAEEHMDKPFEFDALTDRVQAMLSRVEEQA